MGPMTSPNDPVFFLHHCFVERSELLSIAFAQAREQPIAPGRADSHGTLG